MASDSSPKAKRIAKFFFSLCGIGLILLLAWKAGDWMGAAAGRLPTTSEPFPTLTPVPTPSPALRIVVAPPPQLIIPTPTPTPTPIPRLNYLNENDYMVFSPDGKYLAIADNYSGLSVFQCSDRRLIFKSALSGSTDSMRFSNDGQYLAMAVRDSSFPTMGMPPAGRIKIFQTAPWGNYVEWSFSEMPLAIAFSPDDKVIAIRHITEAITLRDLKSEQDTIWSRPPNSVISFMSGGTHGRQTIVYSPDGQYLAVADMIGGIAIRRVTDGQFLARVMAEKKTLQANTHTLVFSPDSKTLWSFGNQVQRWRAPWNSSLANRRKTVLSDSKRLREVSTSPSEPWIAAGGPDSRVLYVWNAQTDSQLWPPKGQEPDSSNFKKLATLRFSPNGILWGVRSQPHTSPEVLFTSWNASHTLKAKNELIPSK